VVSQCRWDLSWASTLSVTLLSLSVTLLSLRITLTVAGLALSCTDRCNGSVSGLHASPRCLVPSPAAAAPDAVQKKLTLRNDSRHVWNGKDNNNSSREEADSPATALSEESFG